jgi:thioredoxin 1
MSDAIAAVTDADFETEVLRSPKPVLVEFWATWCAPCRMIAPVVESLAQELGEGVKFLKMDTDANPKTAMQLGIQSIPTVIIFKDGRPAERTVGYSPAMKGNLKQKLEAVAG